MKIVMTRLDGKLLRVFERRQKAIGLSSAELLRQALITHFKLEVGGDE